MTAVFALLILGQQGEKPGYKVRKAPVVKASAPVTRAEARAVFLRLQRVADRALGGSRGAGEPRFVASKEPLTVALVSAEFGRLADRYRPDFKRLPAGLGPNPGVKALRLVSPTGPIAVGKKTLTTREFGDSVGYFLVRLADLTHTPSHRFSPNLMPDQ